MWNQRTSRFTHSPRKTSMLCDPSPLGGEGYSSHPRQLVVDALDVEIHAEDLPVVEMVAALALDGFSVLRQHRALERVQLARGNRRLGVLRHLLHGVRHV